MELIYISIALFGMAAIVGVYLITQVFQGKHPPKPVAITHGSLAISALVLLIVHTYGSGADLMDVVVLFVIAALGGIALFIRDVRGRSMPRGLAAVHALIALTAFVFVVVYAFTKTHA